MKHRLILLPLAAVILCVGSTLGAEPAATSSASSADGLAPLIPRELLFGNPDRIKPRIAPDGRQLAYIAPAKGVLNVWVRTIGRTDDRAVSNDRNRGIRYFFWAENSRQILYIQDKNANDNWRIYVVDLDKGNVTDLTPFDDVQAQVIATSPSCPDEVLIGLNQRTPHYHDVYRVNTQTGQRTLVYKNEDELIGFRADHNMKLRAAQKWNADGTVSLRVRDDAPSNNPAGGEAWRWRTLTTWGPTDILNTGPIMFTPDNQGLYMASSVGSDTTQLRRIDLATGKEAVIAYDRQYDLAAVTNHPTRHEVQAFAYIADRKRWTVIDESVRGDFAALTSVGSGSFCILDRDRADETWLAAYADDDGPVSYYAYDRKLKKAKLLFANRRALQDVKLAQMKPVTFPARDGLVLHGYLTLPVGIEPKKLPTVLKVHGGPWSRDVWGYDGEVQWLANRGYAVLQVNYRGSTGYGKAFINAGNREWAGKMHDDLIDAVNWVTKLGISDPQRVAIFGASYGGYATLVGLTFTPDVFACGVEAFGPGNLLTFLNSVPPYWTPIMPLLDRRIGSVEKDKEFLESRSPALRIDRVIKPLIIAQGGKDPRVKPQEAREMVKKLRALGRQVEYYEFADEAHGFAKPGNRLRFYAAAERFLAEHLGGRLEPPSPEEAMPQSPVD